MQRMRRRRRMIGTRRVIGPLFDAHLPQRKGSYAFQSAMATLAMLAVLLVEDVVLRAAIVVAMASTIFIIFVVPNSVAATPRKVIGGHVAGVLAASVVTAIIMVPAIASAVDESRLLFNAMAALTVGLSLVLMVMTEAEHPPAAGAALGLVIHGWSWSSVGVIIGGAIALSTMFHPRPRVRRPGSRPERRCAARGTS